MFDFSLFHKMRFGSGYYDSSCWCHFINSQHCSVQIFGQTTSISLHNMGETTGVGGPDFPKIWTDPQLFT